VRKHRHGQRRLANHFNPVRANGFSLVELLITLALLIVMSVMLWGFGSASHQTKQKNRCQDNLQKVFLAMEIYANDFQGDFPFVSTAQNSSQALSVLVPKYSVDTAIFICPGSKDSPLPAGEPFRERKISYAYYMGRRLTDKTEVLISDRQVNTESKTTNQFAFSNTGKPPGNNHHKFGGNFLFGDGHLATSSALAPFPIKLSPSVVLLNP
jgi:type II secretory pathway pseudopilin PulG